MKKVILIDGNNLLFRSYYATVYTGNMMKSSKGFPTNALFGFANMMNKIIKEEKPQYIIVAFDIGKTFRHDTYTEYKGKRNETPEDLKIQFPVAKQMLNKMGITYLEKDGYEADDIIGTIAKEIDLNDEYIGTIISSDRDLLQLVSNDVDIKLLKQSDFIRLNINNMEENYGIGPNRIVDLKALQGDQSDNIPGVAGIGEKTALKLINEYGSIEAIYANIENIKGSVKEKLINGKENAFMSKSLATIYKEVPIDFKFEDIIYNGPNTDELLMMYNDLEFYSMLKEEKKPMTNIDFEIVDKIDLTSNAAYFIETNMTNYHNANILGIAVYDGKKGYFIKDFKNQDLSYLKYTYDEKKNIVLLSKYNKKTNAEEDIMISAYLLNYNIKDDIAYLMKDFSYNALFQEAINKKNSEIKEEDIIKNSVLKAKFIYEENEGFKTKLKEQEMYELYKEVEFPLIEVLADIEITGIKVDKNILLEMQDNIKIKLEILEREIFNHAGESFNISSPKQLGDILFDKLKLPNGKKTKTGYSTDREILDNLLPHHPIISLIIEYRTLSKLLSTYAIGLFDYIKEDGRIHTIFNQALARTGRLSSIEPNLQNIPIKYEYGRLIRKCFVADENSVIMSSDYSQIELRIFAHMANIESLKEAFINNIDIHTKTAMDVFNVPIDMVTKELRRRAKVVNFGILYGQSAFGLSGELGINVNEAKEFIDKYFKSYPGVKDYMNSIIKNAYEDGFVKTLFGRKRTIDELKNSNKMIRNMGERMAINTPIQGTSADILKKAMIDIYKEFKKLNLKSKILIQVHDELVLNVLNSEYETVEKIVKEKMENAFILSVPLIIETGSGQNWYNAK